MGDKLMPNGLSNACRFLLDGRGAHLVERDAIAALDAGRPAMTVLDVTDPEPPPAHSPLWLHPKVRLILHMSSFNRADAVARSVAASVHS